jgi:hypothetical protein
MRADRQAVAQGIDMWLAKVAEMLSATVSWLLMSLARDLLVS